jgi:hypothetical protein
MDAMDGSFHEQVSRDAGGIRLEEFERGRIRKIEKPACVSSGGAGFSQAFRALDGDGGQALEQLPREDIHCPKQVIRVTLDPRAVRWSGLPMPHRRTFADAIVASAHSDRPALRHPAFADRSACGGSVPALKPAPGPWATPPDPMVQQDRLRREDQVGAV